MLTTVLKTGGYLKGLILDPNDVAAVAGALSRATPITFTSYEEKAFTYDGDVPEIKFFLDLKEMKAEPPSDAIPVTDDKL